MFIFTQNFSWKNFMQLNISRVTHFNGHAYHSTISNLTFMTLLGVIIEKNKVWTHNYSFYFLLDVVDVVLR